MSKDPIITKIKTPLGEHSRQLLNFMEKGDLILAKRKQPLSEEIFWGGICKDGSLQISRVRKWKEGLVACLGVATSEASGSSRDFSSNGLKLVEAKPVAPKFRSSPTSWERETYLPEGGA